MKVQLRPEGRAESPCFSCDKRFVGCHASCEGYKAYKDLHHKEVETIKKNKSIINANAYYRTDKEFKNAGKGNNVFRQHLK